MHTRISPSKLSRIIKCPGSLQLCENERLPRETTNPAAEEGTRLHALAEQTMQRILEPKAMIPEIQHEEFLVQAAINYVLGQINANMAAGAEILFHGLEHHVEIAEDISGTVDLWFLFEMNNQCVLEVFDYKFGQTPVSAKDNAQLKAYALGIMNELKTWQPNTIITHIVQPAIENYDSWAYKPVLIHSWWENDVAPAILAAESPDFMNRLIPSHDACKWCRAIPICPKYKELADQTAAEVFAAYSEGAAYEVSDAQLFELYERADVLETYIAAVRHLVRSRLSKGPAFGYKLVRTRGKREWKFDNEHTMDKLVSILEEHGIEPFEAKLRTAPSVLKGNSKLKKTLEPYICNTPGKSLSIVREDDPREAISENPFAGLEELE